MISKLISNECQPGSVVGSNGVWRGLKTPKLVPFLWSSIHVIDKYSSYPNDLLKNRSGRFTEALSKLIMEQCLVKERSGGKLNALAEKK